MFVSLLQQHPQHPIPEKVNNPVVYTGSDDKSSSAHAQLSQVEHLGMSRIQIRAHLHNNSVWLVLELLASVSLYL